MTLQKLQEEIAKLSPQDRTKLRVFLNFLDAAPAALGRPSAPAPAPAPVPAPVPVPALAPKAPPKPTHVNRAAHAGAAAARAAALERLKAARKSNS